MSLENHTATDASIGDLADSDFCTDCHGLPAQHFAGLNTTATDALTDADFVTTWDGTGGNISAAGCAVICHSDTNTVPNPDVPRWTRKWSSTITATTGPECANCHGTQADGWVTGIQHRTDAGPYNTHGQTLTWPQRGCNECHAIGDASYDFTPKWDNTAGGQAGHHGNETIELNNAAPAVPARLSGADSGETGCTGCHNANDGFAPLQHSFPTATRWGFATISNGAYSGCNGCHGSGTGNFWPDNASTNLAQYPNRNGRHVKHIDVIVTRLNADNGWISGGTKTLSPFNLSQSDQGQLCAYCHGANFGGNHYVAGWDGSLDPEERHAAGRRRSRLHQALLDAVRHGRRPAGLRGDDLGHRDGRTSPRAAPAPPRTATTTSPRRRPTAGTAGASRPARCATPTARRTSRTRRT